MGAIVTARTSARGISGRIALGALLAFEMVAALTACAADRPRTLPNRPLEAMPSPGTVGAIQISLEPYETDTRTMAILDKTLISEGLLPILVVLLNGGDVVYELNPYEIFLA